MADYDIFREQLAIKYPSYGHALWGPNPRNPDRPVQVGDVGFIRQGKFHRLFNALLPADHPSHEFGVLEYHEPLVLKLSNHIDTDSLDRNDYCSGGVIVEPDLGYHSGPDDFPQVTFHNKRTRGAAVLSLPVTARRENTLARGDFRRSIMKNIDSWFAFARNLGLGIEQMEDIILVTGCDRTKSWTNVAFLGNQVDAQVSFGVKADGPNTSINFQFSRGNARGAVLRHGPEGTNLPENQCVFIRGFRVARSFWILPRRLKAAAGPSPDPRGYDCDPDTEVISIPAATEYRDPLHLLLNYIAEQASDCDMVVAHDDDLATIDGLGHDSSLETLEPDVMMDLLRKSNIEIDKVSCDLSLADNCPNTDASAVKVAMVSMKLQNRSSGRSALRGARQATKYSIILATEGFAKLIPFTSDILLALDEIRKKPSNVWPSLSKFVHVERDKLLAAVLVTSCAVSLLRWVFSFTWDVIFKLFFTLLLASFPFSVWLERELRYRRQLDERLEAIHNHVMSLQLNPAVPAVVADVRYSLPIMARATPANLVRQGSMQAIIQPVIPEGNTNDRSEEPLIDLGDSDAEHRPRWPGPSIESPVLVPPRLRSKRARDL